MSFVLNVDGALNAFFERQAYDPEFRQECHPSMSEEGWKAYRDLLLREAEPRTGKKEHSGRVSVSLLVRPCGWNCDRFLYFAMVGEKEDAVFRPAMIRTFEVGKGMEMRVYAWITPALEWFYGDRLEIKEVRFERYVFPKDSEEAKLLGGKMDIYLRYKREGKDEDEIVIIDVKSTSDSQMKKRSVGGEVTVEPEYQRQIGVYQYPLNADYGIILYWNKGWPHEFKQAPVHGRSGMVKNVLNRVSLVRDDHLEGRVSMPRRGSYCGTCMYRVTCDAVQKYLDSMEGGC